jgi:hypothetical protein
MILGRDYVGRFILRTTTATAKSKNQIPASNIGLSLWYHMVFAVKPDALASAGVQPNAPPAPDSFLG